MMAPNVLPTENSACEPDDAESGWLMFHSVGKFSGQEEAVKAALATFSEQWCAPDEGRWTLIDQGRREMLNCWADLIGAPRGSVMAAANVTECYYAFFEALPSHALAGRKVIIAEDCFPSLHFLLAGLAPRLGFELVTVRQRPDAAFVEDEDFLAAWNEEVAVAVITWVTSTASRRCDLDALVAHGRSMGSIVTLDITQAVGCLPFDVNAPAIDFAASTPLKWLCGMPGAGMAYVSPALLPRLEPLLRGWFSQPDPFNWQLDRFTFAADARRFDNGTPSYLPYIASLPGLKWLTQTGIRTIRDHNLQLGERLIQIADNHRLRVVSPRSAEKRGGTVVVEIPADHAPADIQRGLMAAGIVCDTRSERMRWSPGLITRGAKLDVLDRELGRVCRS
ncbi:aminotransferase class V-fold PLP-dependent enzyme [Pseudaminobacter soli (ex Li et al. 2025)]|uniref:aminotransferase class V-fold PLP-dependent enzyme n=1 Tax=Pseudaminobacter soli (ex Li et al. 2025) TaxID=1295366 RepID=UPI002473C59A|nr:aminotransferase class V-fold PLP-dependent enzyme [Mesorhizobium soli]